MLSYEKIKMPLEKTKKMLGRGRGKAKILLRFQSEGELWDEGASHPRHGG